MNAKDLDPLIRDLCGIVRFHYLVQAMNCLAGAMNTLVGIWFVLDNWPLFGLFFITVAFWTGQQFCDSMAIQNRAHMDLSKLRKLRAELVEWHSR